MPEPTGRLRFVRRDRVYRKERDGSVTVSSDVLVLQQEWQDRWGHDTGTPWWEDVPIADDLEQV